MKRMLIFSVGSVIFLLVGLNFFVPGIYVAQAGVAETGTPTSTPTKTASASATVTVTATATPGCNAITAGAFVVSGTYLDFYITNENPAPIKLTYTSLIWTDYYDPLMKVDYISWDGVKFYNGDDPDSPTEVDTSGANYTISGGATALWHMRFKGYSSEYGFTHTIGPFAIDLTFDGMCPVHAEIPEVVAWVYKPSDGETITAVNYTNFEIRAFDTGIGNTNGAGIDMIHYQMIESNGNTVFDTATTDTSPPYCVWGPQSPCPLMDPIFWDSLPNGAYTLIAWARSAETFSWSAPAQVTFYLARYPPSATPTMTPSPTGTQTPVRTRFPTNTPTPFPAATDTPTPTTSETPVPNPTRTPPIWPSSTPRPTRVP